jgi:hypothetical protein
MPFAWLISRYNPSRRISLPTWRRYSPSSAVIAGGHQNGAHLRQSGTIGGCAIGQVRAGVWMQQMVNASQNRLRQARALRRDGMNRGSTTLPWVKSMDPWMSSEIRCSWFFGLVIYRLI